MFFLLQHFASPKNLAIIKVRFKDIPLQTEIPCWITLEHVCCKSFRRSECVGAQLPPNCSFDSFAAYHHYLKLTSSYWQPQMPRPPKEGNASTFQAYPNYFRVDVTPLSLALVSLMVTAATLLVLGLVVKLATSQEILCL